MRWISTVALVVLVLLASVASACPRCGSFGRSCKARRVLQKRTVVTPVVTQVIERGAPIVIFNNAGYAAPQGSTAYQPAGYQSFASAYQVNPAAVIQESSRAMHTAADLFRTGMSAYNALASKTLDIQQGGSGAYVMNDTGTERTLEKVPETNTVSVDMGQLAMQVIEGKCIACHNAQTPKGDLDLSSFGDHAVAAGVIDEVISRTLGPLGDHPGKPQMPFEQESLPASELSAFFGYQLQLRYEGLIQ
mgnify:CR=1 FL=1